MEAGWTSGHPAWPVRLHAVTTAEAKLTQQARLTWLQVSRLVCCTLGEARENSSCTVWCVKKMTIMVRLQYGH